MRKTQHITSINGDGAGEKPYPAPPHQKVDYLPNNFFTSL